MILILSVYLNFLLVGHTHEDIDQLFSRVAEHLRRHEVATGPDFRQALATAVSTGLHVEDLAEIPDVKKWQAPQLARLYHFKAQQQFHFTLDPAGRAVVRAKRRSTDTTWLPEAGERLQTTPPQGAPTLRVAETPLDVTTLRKDIPKVLDRLGQLRVDPERRRRAGLWWDDYLDRVEEESTRKCAECQTSCPKGHCWHSP